MSIRGILSHKKLMELKNCGVIEPEFFQNEAEAKFSAYKCTVADNLLTIMAGNWFNKLFYGPKQASRDAGWMFPDRRDMLKHLIHLNGASKYLTVTPQAVDEFTFIHQAAVSADKAQSVLACFRYSDQVVVDEDTGFCIDWLLRNAYALKRILPSKEEENADD